MTFDLVRAGWPNAVAILALALMPVVSLAIPQGPPQQAPLAACDGCDAAEIRLATVSSAE